MAFLLPLWTAAPELVRERIDLRPDGLRFQHRSGPTWIYKTFRWEPMAHIHAGPSNLQGNAVRFEYAASPYIGTQFAIGWNLSREESQAVARLITDYRRDALESS